MNQACRVIVLSMTHLHCLFGSFLLQTPNQMHLFTIVLRIRLHGISTSLFSGRRFHIGF